MKTREQLLDRIAQLEELLGLTADTPSHTKLRERGLAPQEAKLLGLLMQRAMVSLDAGYLALYGDLPDTEQPEGLTTLRTIIKRLRKHLRPLGVEIKNLYGDGYLLEPDQKQKLRALWPELAVQPQRKEFKSRHSAEVAHL